MFSESEYLPISSLQHLLFCERQCALILIENQWRDNRLTILGSLLHRKAHKPGRLRLRDRNVVRSLPVVSRRLGLYGILDVLIQRTTDCGSCDWFPREYKRGRPKKNPCDRVQLCAQAICLEEMSRDSEFSSHFASPLHIAQGQIFYGSTKRVIDVPLTQELRELTERSVMKLHSLLAERKTPPPDYGPKCRNCSLKPVCLPELQDRFKDVASYLNRSFRQAFESGPE